jgi:putative ABC transport system ATP-binding protein
MINITASALLEADTEELEVLAAMAESTSTISTTHSKKLNTDRATAAIEVSGLSKHVRDASGDITILDNIELRIADGETVAITGASGSGKTTLLGLLAGLDLPTRGVVKLLGVDITDLDEDARAKVRARNVGFVFQSFQLLTHLSALENVMLPLELLGFPDARKQAEHMLAEVGLGARFHHSPRTLSGGEQQRVALARAFVIQPRILFADEPTGSLDAQTGEDISALMFALNRERGSTLVMVTHDPVMAARCARRIVLTAGRIVN